MPSILKTVRIALLIATVSISTSSLSPAFGATAKFDKIVTEAKAAMLVDPPRAISLAHEAETFVDKTEPGVQKTSQIATVQWLLGEAYLRIDEASRAVPLIERSYATIDRLQPGTLLHGDLLLSMGGIAAERGDVASALSYYQRAHRVFVNLREERSQSKALTQIAILYYDANDWNSALRYFNEALDVSGSDLKLAASIHNGKGVAFKELKRPHEAEIEFSEALDIARELRSPTLVATILRNAARLELANGNVREAERAIADSRRATGVDTPPEFRRQQDALSAEAAYQRHDYARAAMFLDRIFAGVDLTKTTLADREAHRTAYQTYQALGRDGPALAHLRALKRLDDDATNLARSTSAALMSARFDYANQSLRIANLKAQDAQKTAAYERARAMSQRIIFYGASGATAVLILALLYALRTSRRARMRVQAAADDLAVTNDALGKALAAKTEFLAATSHEIRTPLNGILGMTQVMLADGTLDPDVRDRVTVVDEAGRTMKALVDDILDVAKMETGNLQIEQAPFDLAAVAQAASALWTAQAETKAIGFSVDLAECPGRICGDAARVRQIVFNLLSNAFKFTAAGTVSLVIARVGEDRYRITVADQGIGIPAAKLAMIFEPFRQADTSTTRRFGGTGLGLSICRSLARAMGGEITVDSVEGQGARFVVDLPLVEPDEARAEPCACAEVPDLLIVEHNPIARSMLRAVLASDFGTIGFAGSVAEALSTLSSTGAGFVVVDEATLRADGVPLEACAKLADAARGNVAILWAFASDIERAKLLGTGIADVIAKPVAGADLAARLRTIRGRRSVGGELVREAA